MRGLRIASAVVLVGFLGACTAETVTSGGQASPTPSEITVPSVLASPTFEQRRALIDTGSESVLIDVEVAATPEQRGFGLMHRETLDADAGMVFLWFGPTSASFYMKDTLIPLSIAFFDERGRILKILDMDLCTKDPCRLYDPGVTYWGALEVNQGAFERWGVERGDIITIPS
ncbi:MAG: DUF192 domain-containing protein [Actinomycetota bacterium]